MNQFCVGHVKFKCARCGKKKTVEGRKKYKVIGRDSINRPKYNHQCKECFDEHSGQDA